MTRKRSRRSKQRANRRTQADSQSGLAPQFAKAVPPEAQQRGNSYFRQRHVIEPEVSAGKFQARVRGQGTTYGVIIGMESDGNAQRTALTATCDCPYYRKGRGACKHIWAVVRSIDHAKPPEFQIPEGFSVDLQIAIPTQPRRPAAPKIITRESKTRAAGGAVGSIATAGNSANNRIRSFTAGGVGSRLGGAAVEVQRRNDAPTSWREAVKTVNQALRGAESWEGEGQNLQNLHYVIDVAGSKRLGQLVLTPFRFEFSGETINLSPVAIDARTLSSLPPSADRDVLVQLFGVGSVGARSDREGSLVIAEPERGQRLASLAKTGRLAWQPALSITGPLHKLRWDGDTPWELQLSVTQANEESAWTVKGQLLRADESFNLDQAILALADGTIITEDRILQVTLTDPKTGGWLEGLFKAGAITVDRADQAVFLRTFLNLPGAPSCQVPIESGWAVIVGVPKPRLVFVPSQLMDASIVLLANYEIDYSNKGRPDESIARTARTFVRRDPAQEKLLFESLRAQPGITPTAGRQTAGADVLVDPKAVPQLVETLGNLGWSIEMEGKAMRVAKEFKIDVRSGVDWIDIKARFDFAGSSVGLPEILEGLRRGAKTVTLADGSVGMLPDDWAASWAPILAMGSEQDQGIRIRASQGAFLEVLAGQAANASTDSGFDALRQKLSACRSVKAIEPTADFQGTLREYQKEGLGWLQAISELNVGGCLADDMGLGKTVQVLAHLQHRRRTRAAGEHRPSLLVGPTSLVTNWVDEAKRFAPELIVRAHAGPGRERTAQSLLKADLVVTSYGTMRSDLEMLAGIAFDYVILDEAQAIKNESTLLAKAACTLNGQFRLALSGTPVENRIQELWSIFRFLNPGMLEGASEWAQGTSKLESLAKSLRPFILRRTKEQVLPELPGKTVSDVFCELDPEQRATYDQLAAHYRASLATKASAGDKSLQIHILEALLRLRQLACHPGLIDPQRVGESSAKLDLLFDHIDEVANSGRKCLIFSQFTSLLAIVRARLDQAGTKYAYLDGSTRDRKEVVERFQTQDEVKIFLISLKAGGSGLNLTAADYCFILDPWWNPATEAQAIDRAHRIGQKNHVFAYRLIARGTIEEKILHLQAQKRKIVEGIFAEDGDLLTQLTPTDIDNLLS